MALLANLAVLLIMVGFGFGMRWIYTSFGADYFGLTCLAIVVVGVIHQHWHKWKYGKWYGEEPPVIHLAPEAPKDISSGRDA